MTTQEKIKMILKCIIDSKYRFLCLGPKYYKYMSDEKYLKKLFYYSMGRPLNLDNPSCFNEKLQWLKLYDRRPEYTIMVDKYLVREHVAEKLGNEYLIPLLGVWDDPDEIDFDALPNQFVLKCNHNSGVGMCICKDKSMLDIKKVKEELRKGLKQDYYLTGREWPYKNVPRKIICEEYLQDDENGNLKDYKFFCFNGVADNVMVVAGRAEGNPQYFHFDKNYQLCRFNRLTRSLPENFTAEKPPMMDEMFRIAEKLSQGVPHVRIDLYCVKGHIYFGEYTLYNQSGLETGFDNYSDGYLGSLINLPAKDSK